MKTVIQSFLLTLSLTLTFGAVSQKIVHTVINGTPPNGSDSSMFAIVPLIPSDVDAQFMHFWWFGDNGFSFTAQPKHNHVLPKGSNAIMTAIPTENYGTGGPPPLAFNFSTQHEGISLPKILKKSNSLHVQRYRNAVIHDTMFLIVTYGNSSLETLSGRLKIDVGNYAKVCYDSSRNSHYLPNGESWNAQQNRVIFGDLAPDEERSILIPVLIKPTTESMLNMKISLMDPERGVTIQDFQMEVPVARSHDPNTITAESNAKNRCDYRGGNIHYTVNFQNDGDAPAKYVRIECHLDDKVDLNSIKNVKVPSRFYQNCRKADSNHPIKGTFTQGYNEAIWDIDYAKRMLIIEMHAIRIWPSTDPELPRIDMARGQIEFDILVKDDYVFGKPVLAHAEIFFDDNAPISTDTAEVGCDQPISVEDGGGFTERKPSICDWIWWIIGSLIAVIVLLIILLVRCKRKQKMLRVQ